MTRVLVEETSLALSAGVAAIYVYPDYPHGSVVPDDSFIHGYESSEVVS